MSSSARALYWQFEPQMRANAPSMADIRMQHTVDAEQATRRAQVVEAAAAA
jgi:hypothetical protein